MSIWSSFAAVMRIPCCSVGACIEERCRARFPITDIIYNCPVCGGLLDAVYPDPPLPAADDLEVF